MLTLGFFFIALLYSIVGFGGGSSYLAVLAIAEIPYEIMPKLSLICNLLVVTGGSWHYYRNGNFNKRLVLPFVLSSVPFAFLGGLYPISEKTFMILLAASLVFAGIRLLFVERSESEVVTLPSTLSSFIVGSCLGLLSGLVGLGGGIFLSPLMLNFKWGKAKEVAATASAFIFINSLAGLAGQMLKGVPSDLLDFWPLFLAVLAGGQIGSYISNHKKVSHLFVQRGTAVLILIIGSRILYKILSTVPDLQ
ncbi:MAG TPA: sulfite exporter TauE/SafE family protein [Bacteriovoracaceae bacterium]|nr:sulfite exporter TauE/SafE family protein [Bacteriovoracaceae bacterium]